VAQGGAGGAHSQQGEGRELQGVGQASPITCSQHRPTLNPQPTPHNPPASLTHHEAAANPERVGRAPDGLANHLRKQAVQRRAMQGQAGQGGFTDRAPGSSMTCWWLGEPVATHWLSIRCAGQRQIAQFSLGRCRFTGNPMPPHLPTACLSQLPSLGTLQFTPQHAALAFQTTRQAALQ